MIHIRFCKDNKRKEKDKTSMRKRTFDYNRNSQMTQKRKKMYQM